MDNISTRAIGDFIDRQLGQWPLASENFANLSKVMLRDIEVKGYPMKLQCNPARMISGAAKTDKASLEKRPCFLCRKNRDSRQISIEWENPFDRAKYEILVNLYPVFPGHLVIASAEHTPQKVSSRITAMTELSRLLEGYTVFYNGAKAGASAPDHQHFQGVPSCYLPLWDWVEVTALNVIEENDGYSIGYFKDFPFQAFALKLEENTGREKIAEGFARLSGILAVEETEIDDKVNLFVRNDNGVTTLIAVKRVKHRPSVFSMDTSGFLISPGAIDMAGVFILPRPADFQRLDEKILGEIIDEVVVYDEKFPL